MDTNCYRVDYFQSYWRQITAEGNNTTTGRTEKVELLSSVQQDLGSQTYILITTISTVAIKVLYNHLLAQINP